MALTNARVAETGDDRNIFLRNKLNLVVVDSGNRFGHLNFTLFLMDALAS